ncbi:MAG: hypothetical protein V2A61_06565 [Calditrichota bacterium]
MTKHPFNEGTKREATFTTLSDEQWHCGKHELPGTQPAKNIQIIRQHGFEIENSTRFCEICNDRTVHRRLKSVEPVTDSFIRQAIPKVLKDRVHKLYDNREAITMRKETANLLEVDHRFPQVRWLKDEEFDPNMSDSDLKKKFQLLTRAHNLWKSRYCENCLKNGERGTFIGIDYFAEGNAYWPEDIQSDDEEGCKGCFWYDPGYWRDSLNACLSERKALLKRD